MKDSNLAWFVVGAVIGSFGTAMGILLGLLDTVLACAGAK